MVRMLCKAFLGLFFLVSPTCFAQSNDGAIAICTALLGKGVYDTHSSYSSEDRFNLYKNSLSSYDFKSYKEYSDTAGSLGVDIPVADIVVGLSADSKTDSGKFQQEFSSFKSSTWSQVQSRILNTDNDSHISSSLLTVYDHCQQNYFATVAATLGVVVKVTPQSPPSSFTLDIVGSVPPGGVQGLSITNVEPSNLVSCSVNGHKISYPWSEPTHTNSAILNCQKDPAKQVFVSVKSNLGQRTEIMVPAARNPINDLQDRVALLDVRVSTIAKQLSDALSQTHKPMMLLTGVASVPQPVINTLRPGTNTDAIGDVYVPFPAPFSKPPSVSAGISTLDLGQGVAGNVRLQIFIDPTQVTANGFTARVRSWGASPVYAASINWVASGEY